jgi:L-lactate dehydrogenase complex protein LldG
MGSREKILEEIKRNKPNYIPFTGDLNSLKNSYANTVSKYIETLSGIGGKGELVNGLDDVKAFLASKQSQGLEVVNAVETLGNYNAEAYAKKTAAEVEGVETFFVKGEIGIAENASVWIPERNMANRLLPFICQHLVIVVEANNIVANMHEAYERIKIDEDGYGVFIAGPSKTADIEQSLVIGAHGPLSLHVFIIV